MSKKYPTGQTTCVDDIVCPYCGHKFDGCNATNGDPDCTDTDCPKCKKTMEISVSIEYRATAIE